MRAPSCVFLAAGPALAACLCALSLLPAPVLAQTPAQNPAPTQTPTDPQPPSQSPAPADPPVITIRMLNGKSGKPLGERFIAVEFQNSPQKSMIFINRQGIGNLEIPPGATAFSLIAPAKKWGANQAAYIVCGLFGQFIPVKDVLDHGYVPQNECKSNLKLTAAPGELLYLIEPLPWYTPALE
jgi:hypothetical protein